MTQKVNRNDQLINLPESVCLTISTDSQYVCMLQGVQSYSDFLCKRLASSFLKMKIFHSVQLFTTTGCESTQKEGSANLLVAKSLKNCVEIKEFQI